MNADRPTTRSGTQVWPAQPDGSHAPAEVFGDYLVYEKLGAGGMASVHRAERRGIDGFRRPVALKRMLASVAEDAALVEAFVHEARLTGALKHENIAQAYDLGKHAGTYYIAMELVSGPTLLQVMAQCANAAGAIPLPIAVNILIQICDALDYAHNLRDPRGKPLGIIHRDVSPGNIIISNTGIVKLIDFGIAKAATARAQTEAGFIKGKFAYVAPEYIGGKLDARADLFGLGVVAHELLTNQRLFRGKNDLETLRNLREMRVRRPSRQNPDVPAALDDIVLTALQRDPAKRWQTAAEMRASLLQVAWELGVPVGHQQVLEWMVWAFSQKPQRMATELGELLEVLEPSAPPTTPRVQNSRPEQATVAERGLALRNKSLRNKSLRNTSRNTGVQVVRRASPPPIPPPRPTQRPATPRRLGSHPGAQPSVTETTFARMTTIRRPVSRPWLVVSLSLMFVTAAWYF